MIGKNWLYEEVRKDYERGNPVPKSISTGAPIAAPIALAGG
jgi:hypothetical protein